MTKKGEISISKTVAQLDSMVPPDLKEFAKNAVIACKDVRKFRSLQFRFGFLGDNNLVLSFLEGGYKDSCDKAFYLVKCTYEQNPEKFMFP